MVSTGRAVSALKYGTVLAFGFGLGVVVFGGAGSESADQRAR
ncbi:hypothetical protein ACFFQF_06920 [Haladaptatus pallidirubidus]